MHGTSLNGEGKDDVPAKRRQESVWVRPQRPRSDILPIQNTSAVRWRV